MPHPFGLGAVLLQKEESEWKPVAYASRSMTETERRYAQIEKEALAITWAFEKFSSYVLGKSISVETDHKPLVPLLSSKHLDTLPVRILRFRLCLDHFDYVINHVPGKLLYVADTLSRSPLATTTTTDNLEYLAELAARAVIAHIPGSTERLDIYRYAQSQDRTCTILKEYCLTNWPNHKAVDPAARRYWEARGELTICANLLLYGRRIVIPEKLREETLQTSPRPPRHTTLPAQSPDLCMVARNFKRNQRND